MRTAPLTGLRSPGEPKVGVSRSIDAAAILTVYIVVLLSIRSVLVVPALGTAGAPATIVAIGAFLWWVWYHVQRIHRIDVGVQPLRIAILGLLLAVMASYVLAMSAPMPGNELTPADSGLLKMIGMAGLAMVAAEGISSLDRLHAVVRRLVIGIGLVAVLGLLQFVTRQALVDRISIPGLSARGIEIGLYERSGMPRLSGTSTHPIEYGVILSMVLPLVIVYALHAPTRRWLYRAVLAVVAIAIFMVISRSAILCTAVAILVLALRWRWRMRLVALGCLAAISGLVYLVVPGMLGVLTGLFVGAGDDASVASRTDAYGVALQFIARDPWLGRGPGTFLPQYWILDNQYLGHTIETGLIGMAALLAVILVAAFMARSARKAATTDFDRELAQGLLAAVLAGATAMAFYDLFAFPQSSGCFFLAVGLAGALHRLVKQEPMELSPGIHDAAVRPDVALPDVARR
ncbi:O-antigen ligase [Nocardioides sp. YR527]|uniref:O-antigen ligase family protein n=1 Tax=Nocardioides sp. YR527 TaxID=1881028 RepID=UPI00088E51AC|nr:O-antigen ligase family protein [Nocardioides sp. YR527]SDK96649.1 O-antigen ligase [Nocardioides sp. YR527]